jgi:hypothetical protein
VVPACGALVAGGWFLVALIVGLGETHRCGTGRAAAATLAPGFFLACLCCAGGASLTAALVGSGMAPRP